jgi:hypothetical protein
MLEAVFSIGSALRLYNKDRRPAECSRKEGYVLTKLQWGLIAIETWCKLWNIEIKEDKTQTIYIAHRLTPPEAHLIFNGQLSPLSIM